MTSIQWTDRSWNPIRARNDVTGKRGHHCEKISAGCANCYAASINRFRGAGQEYTKQGGSIVELYLDEKALLEPLKWRKPQMCFPCSMTDMFLGAVPNEWLFRIFAVMTLAAQRGHVFQVLTKRPERMHVFWRLAWTMIHYQATRLNPKQLSVIDDDMHTACRNIWLGVSVENKATRWRIDELRNIEHVSKFVSFEPLLEDLGVLNLEGIKWGIGGGESGPKARQSDLDAHRSLRDQCAAAGVAFFEKQLGSNPVERVCQCGDWHSDHPNDGPSIVSGRLHPCQGYVPAQIVEHNEIREPKGGNPEEWPVDLRVRQWPPGMEVSA